MSESTLLPNGYASDYPFLAVDPTTASDQLTKIAAERSMTRVSMPYGGEAWAINRHSAAQSMLTDPRFVRRPFRTREREVPNYFEFPQFLIDTLQFDDPPEHTKLRRLCQVAISPRRVKALRDGTTEYANYLLDEMEKKGDSANLIDEYALQLPIQVLSELLGVRPEDREKFMHWATVLFDLGTLPEEEVKKSFNETRDYMLDLIAERRREPREDLISALANARDKDDTLTDEEIIPIAMILIVAGFDNTANMIGTGVHALLNNPDQLAILLADIDGTIESAVEEILRHGSFATGKPVGAGGGLVPFIATEDVNIEGIVIKEGEAVFIDPNGVNHDAAVFEHPAEFDVTRKDNPHMMLSYGLHYCLGAPLARMEVQVAIAELFKRFPHLKLTGEVDYNYEILTQTMTELPVSW